MRSFLLLLAVVFTSIMGNASPAEAYYLYWYRGQCMLIPKMAVTASLKTLLVETVYRMSSGIICRSGVIHPQGMLSL